MLDRPPGESGEGAGRAAPYIGRPLPRFEDERLIAGKGRFTDDFRLPDECHAVFVRSPVPSARIVRVSSAEALLRTGVLAVLTGADYVAVGGGPIGHFADPADAHDHTRRAFRSFPDTVSIDIPHLPMPVERVRYLGEPVAMVVAETAALAQDAAELVEVEYEELPHVLAAERAEEPGAPRVEESLKDNLVVHAHFGDHDATARALADSALVVDQRFVNQRVANAQMEPRSAIVGFDPATRIYSMIAGSQGAARQRDMLAAALGVANDQVEVVCPDVGGGFGPRTNLAPEQPMLAVAARIVGRPVRWTSTRSEAFLTDYQGRDLVIRARMGFASDGRITAYACDIVGNVGAYTVSFVPMANSFRIMTSVYVVPHAAVTIHGALTNTAPTGPYRGAGRPEAHLAIERTLDIAARRLGMDRVEIRRRNIVRRAQLPYTSPMGLTYDSGDFAANMERALEAADWTGFGARRAAAEARGKFAGIGLANYVEAPVGMAHERIEIAVEAEGRVRVVTGTQSTGQGHETSFAQVVADLLGVKPHQVALVSGDTRLVRSGGGTHSDRSMRLGGKLLVESAGKIVEKARLILATRLGCAAGDVSFSDGLFRAEGSNESFDVFEVARLASADATLPDSLCGGLSASATFTGRLPAYPTGAAVCEVGVDPETGLVEVTRYTSIDDVGQPINPLILHGQVHGGIVQGVGQALMEQMVHDGSGQLATGSFMDYAMVRADHMPNFTVALMEDPTRGNPLRVKGGGESGITPALAATMNAVVDALARFGIEHVDMPAMPARVRALIAAALGAPHGLNHALGRNHG
ncbi:MAG: xanthine dehydrogenase family protein [Hyphomicrobiaceae bacterium]|nr:xanthine dehydrogenase family protein [Hyphomicrobiaceae bacterium]